MAVIDQLEVIDGYFDGDRFIMRGLGGNAVQGIYRAEGLSSLARIIHDNEPFSFIIDKDRTLFVPVELNKQIKKELDLIADELESSQ